MGVWVPELTTSTRCRWTAARHRPSRSASSTPSPKNFVAISISIVIYIDIDIDRDLHGYIDFLYRYVDLDISCMLQEERVVPPACGARVGARGRGGGGAGGGRTRKRLCWHVTVNKGDLMMQGARESGWLLVVVSGHCFVVKSLTLTRVRARDRLLSFSPSLSFSLSLSHPLSLSLSLSLCLSVTSPSSSPSPSPPLSFSIPPSLRRAISVWDLVSLDIDTFFHSIIPLLPPQCPLTSCHVFSTPPFPSLVLLLLPHVVQLVT